MAQDHSIDPGDDKEFWAADQLPLKRCKGPLCKGASKPLDRFGWQKRPGGRKSRRCYCRECDAHIMRERLVLHREKVHAAGEKWARKNPEKVKRKHRRNNLKACYGLSVSEVEFMNARQGGLCAICGQAESYKSTVGKPCPLSVDHDHLTGRVRALLCARCNHVLGNAKESPQTLRAAADYLEYWKARHAKERGTK